MKLFLLNFFIIQFLIPLNAQENLIINYNCILETVNKELEGKGELRINVDKSIYIHLDAPKKTSAVMEGFGARVTVGDEEGWPVYMDRSTNKMIHKTRAARLPKFIIEESMPKINWSIGNQYKTILGYKCINAIGSYGNRIYDVWFTVEIPIPLGPYKLNGLPGLIMKAESRDGIVKFDCISVEKSNDLVITPPVDGTPATYDDIKKFYISSLLKSEAQSTAEVKATENDPPANCEIEKSKWTFITDYKAQRSN